MENPSLPIFVAQLSDPALALSPPGALAKYKTSRSYADLAALGASGVVLYKLRPLSAEQRASLMSIETPESKWLLAARLSVVSVVRENANVTADKVTGPEDPLPEVTELPGGGKPRWPQLSDEGVAQLVALGGGALLDELGELALERATVHPRSLAPFGRRSRSGESP